MNNCCRTAIDLDPKDALARRLLGVLLSLESRYREAEETFRKAIEIDHENAIFHCDLGELLYKQNRLNEAIDALSVSIKLNDRYVNSYMVLASIYKKLERQKESKNFSDKAFALINEDDYYNLACLHSIVDRKDEALRFLKLAIETDSSFRLLAKTDYDFEWIRDDERFQKIVSGDGV